MASSYQSKFPLDTVVHQGIANYFEDFYKTSDTPDAHEKYVTFFTADAQLIMASKVSNGRDEILNLRKAMWEAVHSRQHRIEKIFPFGSNSSEFMIYGFVIYELKNGKQAEVPWGARAALTKESDQWKMEFYQVYLDTAAAQNAK